MKNSINIKSMLVVCFAGVLAACGGGGGSSGNNNSSSNSSSNSSPTRLSGTPLAIQSSSYLNFKNIGLQPENVPGSVSGNGTTARAYGDFTRTGNIDLITATITYDVTLPISAATPSTLRYWKVMSDGTFVEDSSKLSSTAGCIHPRKALVADFNSDGIPDVFLSCHGYDSGTYAGEKNKIILSQANGNFLVTDASTDIGYWHSASALDVNSDGAIDVVAVTGGNRLTTFINNGSGNFTIEPTGRFSTLASNGYYTIEAIDIDNDGYKDILLGGHEFDGAITSVLFNPGNYNFNGVNPFALPVVAGKGVVLDFVVTSPGQNATIWVLRTGDGSNFYVGKYVQKISVQSLNSSLPLQDQTGSWIPWIIPTSISSTNYISSDLSSANFKVQY